MTRALREPLLPRPFEIAAIPSGGSSVPIVATEAEREAIAGAFGLVSVNALAADVDIGRPAAGLITIDGRVRAEIVQTCVVSLEPVVQSIDEPISARFTTAPPREGLRSGAEVMVDIHSEPPEPVSGPVIDVGEVVLEHFALSIDPYPRAAGAELPERLEEENEPHESPFAALARWRDRKN